MKGMVGVAAASLAVLAIGASAAGGAAERKDVRVEGSITALRATSISVTPATRSAVTCAIPQGTTLGGFALQQRVEMRCRRSGDRLVLRRLRALRDDDEVEVRGRLTAVSTTSVTVDPARGAPVTCDVPAAASVAGFGVGDLVELECGRRNGRLVLRELEHEDDANRGGDDDDERCEGGGRGRH